jgi:hypothetical protein
MKFFGFIGFVEFLGFIELLGLKKNTTEPRNPKNSTNRNPLKFFPRVYRMLIYYMECLKESSSDATTGSQG